MTNITWYELRAPPNQKALPRWKRKIGRTDDGQIFVSAVIAQRSEMEVFLCASYDGTPAYEDKGHIYVPLDWLEREFPKAADNYAVVREAMAATA